MIIPYQELEPDTLRNLVTEFVSRDGTDNGYDQDLDSRIGQVIAHLKSGEAVIVYDMELESTNIIPKAEAVNFE